MQKQSLRVVLYRFVMALSAALATVAGAIAAPILCRPFYYAQIRSLQIGKRTGLSDAVIRGAYDEVMDFLVYGAPFGTGALAYTAEGESHFVLPPPFCAGFLGAGRERSGLAGFAGGSFVSKEKRCRLRAAKAFAGAPPGFCSNTRCPAGDTPQGVKSIRISPNAVTSYIILPLSPDIFCKNISPLNV